MEKHFKLHHAIYIIIFGVVCGISWNSNALTPTEKFQKKEAEARHQKAIDDANNALDNITNKYNEHCEDPSEMASATCTVLNEQVKRAKYALREAQNAPIMY